MAPVAAHAAEAIKSVATNFDEQEVNAKLQELERIVDEAITRKEDEKNEK
jgi:hypothetical protein